MLLVFIVAVISFFVIQERRKFVKIEFDNVRYVEIIRFPDSYMKNIEDKKQVKVIIKKLNSLKGDYVGSENRSDSEVALINVYDNRGNKIEFAKTGNYISVKGKWYKVGADATSAYDSIFASYY